jgi:excisionase family DNA binding protein
MSLERHYSLRQAAASLGIGRHALIQMLAAAGYVLPGLRDGQKYLIPESAIQEALHKRAPRKEAA